MNAGRTIRVVLAKPGLDGHDQGAKVVARALLDAGFDVHYTGLRQSPEQVRDAALQFDADVIALSSMAGAHLAFGERLKPLLEQAGLQDKLWIFGGNIPVSDHDALRALGFDAVFATGSKLDAITDFIKANVKAPPEAASGRLPPGGAASGPAEPVARRPLGKDAQDKSRARSN
ncbi:MAG: cobalamin-dependent protein [Burkholderiaceae bacterium]|nr:cobalamin B12-binding domain-containing protein [Ideonella sp.]MCC7288289.1 cobalamin-dependent protein [Burkholderiaceae bacterium]